MDWVHRLKIRRAAAEYLRSTQESVDRLAQAICPHPQAELGDVWVCPECEAVVDWWGEKHG